MTEQQPTPEINVDKIKLIKNTKGYQWELTSLGLDIEKLKAVNESMIKAFGNNDTTEKEVQ